MKRRPLQNQMRLLSPYPPQFFDGDQNSAPVLTGGVTEPWLTYQDPPFDPDTPHNTTTLCCSKQESWESESARTAREDAKYDALAETDTINIADGYATFCRKFKHLESCISYNLQDDDDIEA
jgi:hypothetical protein